MAKRKKRPSLLRRARSLAKRAFSGRAADVRRARALAAGFHGSLHGAQTLRVRAPRLGGAAIVVGQLDAVLYTTPQGERFKHSFRPRSRPTLIASGDGSQLAIVKGRYRFTARGIVDN